MTMEYRISENVKNVAHVTYALGDREMHVKLDCGEGVNTVMPCEAAKRAFAKMNFGLCCEYPHDSALKDALVARWRTISRENIMLTEGSLGALYLTNRIFLERGCAVLGEASAFYEYATDVRLHGARFDEVTHAEDGRFDTERFLDAMTPEYRLFHLDNPNNPTGQAIPLSEVEAIVERARELGSCVLVDEAYGDFTEDENSAIGLFDRYENVLVARTFSKAYGLAGLRAGYLVLPKALLPLAETLTNPYVVSAMSRFLAEVALGEKDFLPRLRSDIAMTKRQLLRPWRRMKIAHTCETVNICMIVHENVTLDLAAEFARCGVLVISCFPFAGKNAVRLRVPASSDMPFLLSVMEEIDGIE